MEKQKDSDKVNRPPSLCQILYDFAMGLQDILEMRDKLDAGLIIPDDYYKALNEVCTQAKRGLDARQDFRDEINASIASSAMETLIQNRKIK